MENITEAVLETVRRANRDGKNMPDKLFEAIRTVDMNKLVKAEVEWQSKDHPMSAVIAQAMHIELVQVLNNNKLATHLIEGMFIAGWLVGREEHVVDEKGNG